MEHSQRFKQHFIFEEKKELDTSSPVSYTHLDVYKRQKKRFEMMCWSS